MHTVTNFLLLPLLILSGVLMVTSRFCTHNYYATKTGECIPCGPCGIDEVLVRNCGHDHNGDMIPGRSRCRKCLKDEYKVESRHTSFCLPCSKCYGQRLKSACSATADAVCEDCPKGFYEFDNECHKCSRCCHGSQKVKRIAKCLQDGMAESHSCFPNPFCSNFGTNDLKLKSIPNVPTFKSSLARLSADISKRNRKLEADISESRKRMLDNRKLAAKLAQETNRLLEKQFAMLKDTRARMEADRKKLDKIMSG